MKRHEPKHLKRWTHPEHYSGSTYYDYFCTGIGQCRDSSPFDRANFAAMLDRLGGESETVIVVRAGHWAVGWVESILIHESDTKSLKTADDIMSSFNDYPVIDDSILADFEQEEIDSTFENYLSSFRDTICNMAGLDFDSLTKQEQMEVDSLARGALEEDQRYSGVEEAFVTDESIMRYLFECSADRDGLNLTAYLKASFDVREEETYWNWKQRMSSTDEVSQSWRGGK